MYTLIRMNTKYFFYILSLLTLIISHFFIKTYNILVGLDAHREETEKHHLKEKTLLQEAEDSRRRGRIMVTFEI